MMGLLGRESSLTISLAVWIQYTNVTDGQTDRRTPGDSKDRAYIRIASRGKNAIIDDDGELTNYR